MNQQFDRANKVLINRDDKGVVRELLHNEEQIVSAESTPQLAAADYLARFGGLLGLGSGETANLGQTHETDLVPAGDELRFQREKQQFDTTTVMYQQTHFGLPVWHSGIAIHMKGKPYRIVSSQSTRHPDVEVSRPPTEAMDRLKNLTPEQLVTPLGLSAASDYDPGTLTIQTVQPIIYRYAAAKRAIIETAPADPTAFGHDHPTLPLPAVPSGMVEGRHYVSGEVHFTLATRAGESLNWIAIVEAESLSVLYLRAFADNVNGLVFVDDPMTTNGGPLPSATTTALNPVRTSVPLQGLTASAPQALTGALIRLQDVETPAVAAPTEPVGTDFNFDSRTDDFSAVNAYYHCDRFFRLMQDLGFNLSDFFGTGTAFPSTVDHRGFGGNVVNAHCVGTSGGLGIARTTFALADTSDVTHPIGIACDYRVVLHELGGHGVLYPAVHSPNFGFSHSAGDSVAAITCDPDSHAPDRFVTFPWVNIGRRHDRAVSAGWGWSGNIALHPFDFALDGGGYNNEQILCTTLFRFYRSIGGDAAELATRRFAARYTVYLILRAISTLTPPTNPSNAAGFATALMNADLGDWTSEGQTGGAYGKVIRWSFEKQGLYQPPGTPTPNNQVGAPPPVDVYIDDGRQGEYQYQPNFWNCQEIWNRRHADGGTTHEEPVVGRTNFAYTRIRNRGSQAATNVVVSGFSANPAAGLVYPNDWHPMTTAQLAAPDVPPNDSAAVVVGPFAWVPTAVGHECMFMVVAATGDLSNVSNLTPGEAIPEWRLVPNDNNIGQRNVFPVAAGSLKALLHALHDVKINIKNPHQVPARMLVRPVLPALLVTAGWSVTFDNPGGGAFTLNPGETKVVALSLKAGRMPAAKDIVRATRAQLHVEAYANGILVGGVAFELDLKKRSPAKPGTPAR